MARIASLTEMLELPNSCLKWQNILMSSALFQNTFILEKSRIANFAYMIKMATVLIKTKFKDFRNYLLKCNLYLHFLTQQKLLTFCEKMQMSVELKGCVE